MEWQDLIEQRPDVMLGKAVFKGTRLTVQTVLERLSNGATDADVLHDYPRLSSLHIRAAMAYAASAISDEQTLFIKN